MVAGGAGVAETVEYLESVRDVIDLQTARRWWLSSSRFAGHLLPLQSSTG